VDLNSAEDSKIVKMACALAAAVMCLAICFRLVLNHTLTKFTVSLTEGLVVADDIDSILDDLDLLGINQRAFLSSGDDRFSDDVAESVTGLISHLESLKQVSVNGEPLRRRTGKLSHSIDWVLESVGKSFELQQTSGSAVAIAALDNDDAIKDAKMEALALKTLATNGVFDRMRSEREMRSILEVLF
jgi:CHASE3 domain sensor protein